jgi:ribosomal protein L37E
MSDVGVKMRCQRCGDQMDMRDPPPGTPWQPNQFWVCQRCGRHYWTTYPTQPGAAAATPAAPVAAAAAAKPAAE